PQLARLSLHDALPISDVPSVTGTLPNAEEEVVREADDIGPFSALAFKIMTDPYVGKLTFFRVYSGVLNSGSYVLNSTKGKRERVDRKSTSLNSSPEKI